MKNKITGFLREYVFGLSIITIILGLLLIFMGIIWYLVGEDSLKSGELQLGFYTDTIISLEGWNFYLLIIGFIIFGIGIWYLYSYLKDRKFVLEELQTNKRSELLKKHSELKEIVKHLPSKYKKMLKEREEELRIK